MPNPARNEDYSDDDGHHSDDEHASDDEENQEPAEENVSESGEESDEDASDKMQAIKQLVKKLPPTTPQRLLRSNRSTFVEPEIKKSEEDEEGSEDEEVDDESGSDEEEEDNVPLVNVKIKSEKTESKVIAAQPEMEKVEEPKLKEPEKPLLEVQLPIRDLATLSNLSIAMEDQRQFDAILEKLKSLKRDNKLALKHLLRLFLDDSITSDISYASKSGLVTSLKTMYNSIYQVTLDAWSDGKHESFKSSMSSAFKDAKNRYKKNLSAATTNSSAPNDSSMDISDVSKNAEDDGQPPPMAHEVNVIVTTPGATTAVTSTPHVQKMANTTIANGMSPISAIPSTPAPVRKTVNRKAPQKQQMTAPQQNAVMQQNTVQQKVVVQQNPAAQQKIVNQNRQVRQQATKQPITAQVQAQAQALPSFSTIVSQGQQNDIYNQIEPYNPQPQQSLLIRAQNQTPQQLQSVMSLARQNTPALPPPPFVTNGINEMNRKLNQNGSTLTELKKAAARNQSPHSPVVNGIQPQTQNYGPTMINVQNLPPITEQQFFIVNPEQALPKPVIQQQNIPRRMSVFQTDPTQPRKVLKQINIPQGITISRTNAAQQQQGVKRAFTGIPFTSQTVVPPSRSQNGLYIPEPLDSNQNSSNQQSMQLEYYKNELLNLKLKYNTLVQQCNSMMQKEQARTSKAKEIVNHFNHVANMMKEWTNN